MFIEGKVTVGTSMPSPLPQPAERHTSRVTKCILSRRGVHASQPAETTGLLNHIDFRRPIEVMANGPDGLATSDNHSQINGVVVLPDGNRLPATSALGS